MPQNTALNLIHKQISNYHTLNRHSKVPLEHCRSLWHFHACSANLKAQIHCASLLPLPPFQQLTSQRQKGILFSSLLFIIISQPSFIKSSTKSPPPPLSKVRYFPLWLKILFVSSRKVYSRPMSKSRLPENHVSLKKLFVPCTHFVHSRQPDLETESLKNKSCFYIITTQLWICQGPVQSYNFCSLKEKQNICFKQMLIFVLTPVKKYCVY